MPKSMTDVTGAARTRGGSARGPPRDPPRECGPSVKVLAEAACFVAVGSGFAAVGGRRECAARHVQLRIGLRARAQLAPQLAPCTDSAIMHAPRASPGAHPSPAHSCDVHPFHKARFTPPSQHGLRFSSGRSLLVTPSCWRTQRTSGPCRRTSPEQDGRAALRTHDRDGDLRSAAWSLQSAASQRPLVTHLGRDVFALGLREAARHRVVVVRSHNPHVVR
jgi:hypothetical protein